MSIITALENFFHENPQTLEELYDKYTSLKEELGNLSAAEKELLKTLPLGEDVDLNSGDTEAVDPEDLEDDRIIHAKLLRWICMNKSASAYIHKSGIKIIGAKITGDLDLSSAKLDCPLELNSCKTEDILLTNADIATLSLEGTLAGHINANCLKTTGNLTLRNSSVTKALWLLGAKIGGDLVCTNAKLSKDVNRVCTDEELKKDVNRALSADRIEVTGKIYFDKGFKATGRANLVNALVGGDLNCDKGEFHNETKLSLNAEGITTGGSIYLRDGFKSFGKFAINGAKIGGYLGCRGGIFENTSEEEKVALDANNITTGLNVFFDDGFHSKGIILIAGATINGNLDCTEGKFEHNGNTAFVGSRMMVKGEFSWRPEETPKGIINLSGAKVGEINGEGFKAEKWAEPNMLYLDGFEYNRISHIHTKDPANVWMPWLELQYPDDLETGIIRKTRNYFLKTKPYDNFRYLPEGEYRPQPYEQLASVFRTMGYPKNARKVLIAKQEAYRKGSEISLRKRLWNGFLYHITSHGWEPWKAISFLILFFVLGSCLFWSADCKELMMPTKGLITYKDRLPAKAPEEPQKVVGLHQGYPTFNPTIYSIDTLLPFVNLHQESYWLPDENQTGGQFYRRYLWFHIVIGKLLSILLLASISRFIGKK